MIEDAIEILTKMMIEDRFKDEKGNRVTKCTLTKTELYTFCIKLLKIVKKEMEND